MTYRILATCLAAGLASSVSAHPHVFVDGGLGFVVNEQHKLTHLRVTWIFDPFYSLFVMQEDGIDTDADGILTQEEQVRLGVLFSQWIGDYEGDSYLWVGEERQSLSRPIGAEGHLDSEGRIHITFLRELARPADATAPEITAKAYDPTYYTYYAITEAPRVAGPNDCRTELIPVKLDEQLISMQTMLMDYDPYATPEDPDVGAKFADTIQLICGS